MDEITVTGQGVVTATEKHARDISRIYRSVLITPQIFLDLVSSSSQRSGAARQFIKSHGGFLSPPTETDMQLGLQHGLVMVFLQDGEVVGYNRYATDPETVHQALFSEFQLDPSKDHSDRDSLNDWSGSKKLKDYKTLTSVKWLDKEQALITLKAAHAGMENKATGRLAWAIDSAVHPRNQHLGIGKILSKCMRQTLKPSIGFLAYRMFEICKINHKQMAIHNDPSKRAFVGAASKLFAYTEEDIITNSDIHITVRWNHWLKRY